MVEGGGSVIAAFFLAHNYVSEQFGNYVEYGTFYRPLSRRLDRCDRMIQNEGNDSRKLFTLKIALCR